MKIFNNEVITQPQSKFLEIKDKVVINTNVYDSQSMTQIPYSSFINNSNGAYLHNRIVSSSVSLNRNTLADVSNNISCHYCMDYNNRQSVQDEFDPNSVYLFYLPGSVAGVSNTARVEKVTANGDTVTKNLALGFTTYAIKYAGQDQDYLYIIAHARSYFDIATTTHTSACIMYKVRKSDMVSAGSVNINAVCKDMPNVIYQNSDYIFLSYLSNGGAVYKMSRYKKSDTSVTTVDMKKTTTTECWPRESYVNIYKENNLTICFSGASSGTAATISPGITSAKLDFTNDVKIASPTNDWINRAHAACTISWGAFTAEKTQFEANVSNLYLGRMVYITKTATKNYVSFFFNYSANTTAKTNTGIYTFQIISGDELKFVSRLLIDGTERNPLFIGTDSINEMWVPSDIALYYIKFNSATEAFEIIDTKFIVTGSIGLDTLGRVWAIEESTKQLHMYNETLVEKVNISFKNTNIDYIGADIANDIIINCLNNSGQKVAFDVELTIVGNAIFTSNSAKKITVKSLVDADLEVPITIKGPGQISVYPKVVI